MHLCVSLGWGWEQVENLTMLQLRAFRAYFEEHPPLHLAAAALAGFSRGSADRRAAPSPAALAAFEALLTKAVAEP